MTAKTYWRAADGAFASVAVQYIDAELLPLIASQESRGFIRPAAALQCPAPIVRGSNRKSFNGGLRLRMFDSGYNSEIAVRRAEFPFYRQRLVRSGRDRCSIEII